MHLTNRPEKAHSLTVADHSAAGAPEHEIEVTPEMTRAGIAAYSCWDDLSEEVSDMVERVYRAMRSA